MDILQQTPADMEQACDALRAGKLVIWPSPLWYGLSASALNAEAVRRLYHAKRRDVRKALLVLTQGAEDAEQYGHLNPIARQLIEVFWPGYFGVIVEKKVDEKARRTRMRIAVISDIHGNCVALDAVLADIRRQAVQHIVCLGDAIQGGAQPAETVQCLRDLHCPVVMGNADAWLLTGRETSSQEQTSPQQWAVREWSLAQLSNEDRAFIEQFQPTVELSLEADKKLLCFHGSPHSFDDILPNTSEEDFQRLLGGQDAMLLAGGHTHTQQFRRCNDAWYVNPGSVGFAYNWRLPQEEFHADPWEEYALISSEQEQIGVEFRHIPFDVESMLEVLQCSGRPYIESTLAMYGRK